jgi:hypothetical protein
LKICQAFFAKNAIFSAIFLPFLHKQHSEVAKINHFSPFFCKKLLHFSGDCAIITGVKTKYAM